MDEYQETVLSNESHVDQVEGLTQRSYKPTQYEDSSWEIIGDPPKQEEFVPTQFEVVSDVRLNVDPMFEDFGDIVKNSSAIRWHLPEGVEYKSDQSLAKKDKEEEIPTTSLTDEEIENIRKAAYEEGYSVAMQSIQDDKANMEAVYSQQVEGILLDLQKQIEENLLEVEKKSLSLALAISKKIIDGAVEINPEYIVDIINKAIVLTGTAEVKTIRLSPQDYEFVTVVGVGKSIKGFTEAWQFVSDPLVRSGCIVETTAGEIDYQLDPAWERVQDQILKIVK